MASRWIKAGGVIAYPTEAVFGLGCEPSDPLAVTRLLAIKKRSPDKGLILVAADWAQLQPWLQPQPADLQRRMLRSWPGPVTWLVPAADACPSWLTGAHSTLAVRVSAHPVVRDLCQRVGSALVSTSANFSGRPPAVSALMVRWTLGKEIDYVLTGPLGQQKKPTEIRDLRTGTVLRRG